MAAGLRNNIHSSNTRTVDKNLEDSQSTGSLDLSSRKLSDFPRTAESYDLADTVEASKYKLSWSEGELLSDHSQFEFEFMFDFGRDFHEIKSWWWSEDFLKYFSKLDTLAGEDGDNH